MLVGDGLKTLLSDPFCLFLFFCAVAVGDGVIPFASLGVLGRG